MGNSPGFLGRRVGRIAMNRRLEGIVGKSCFLIWIIALAIALSGCGGPEGEASPVPEDSAAVQQDTPVEEIAGSGQMEAELPFRYGRQFLTEQEQEVYDRLLEQAEGPGYFAEVALPVGIDDYAAGRLLTFFCYDNPQIFWGTPELTVNTSGARCLRITAEQPPEELARRSEKLEAAASNFLEGVSGDDFRVVSMIHDRLVRWVSRDTGAEIPGADNIYGTLVDGFAICDGYAKAFQYLVAQKGIPCVYYAGESSATGTPHAWNAVKMDGEWYYVDVTWDSLTPGLTLHTHLGITLEEVLRERTFLQDQYPEIIQAEATDGNYYNHNGYAVFPRDETTPVRQMAEAFVNQLEDMSLSAEKRKEFLEIKIMADTEQYRGYREIFIQDVFLVLREMERIIGERGLPIAIETQGSINCNYKDMMQILVLFPVVAELPADGGG